MDAEGYIPVSLVASFYRVQALSQDQDLILQVSILRKIVDVMVEKELTTH